MSIKANELRVGNLVLMVFENVVETVNARMIGYISKSNEQNHPHPFEPILLTPEILEKCGFESDTDFSGHVFDSDLGVSIGVENTGVCYYKGNLETYWVDVLQEIKYLHQLQNLYFALTGAELTYTL